MFYERQRMARPTLDEKELKRRIAAAAVADKARAKARAKAKKEPAHA